MKRILIFLFVLALFSGCTGAEVAEDHHDDDDEHVAEHEIYPGEVAELIAAGNRPLIIDLRSTEEYAAGHAAGAISLSFGELSVSSLREAGFDESDVIFVYDTSGRQGEAAVNILNSMGYENVFSMAGGFVHWEEDEYPVEKGESAPVEKGQKEVEGGPRIHAEETSHDFGLITQYGGVVAHDFTIENTGDEVLLIKAISTSCACASAEIDKTELAPAETAIVKATFDPDVHEEPEGRFRRTIFIESNDPTKVEYMLTVYVDIEEGK
jgi:rhodanese-related sulfurtransferase